MIESIDHSMLDSFEAKTIRNEIYYQKEKMAMNVGAFISYSSTGDMENVH